MAQKPKDEELEPSRQSAKPSRAPRTRHAANAKSSASATTEAPPRTKLAARRRLLDSDTRLVEQLTVDEVNEIAETVEESLHASGRSKITGRRLPSGSALAKVRKENLMRAFSERRELLADALTVNEVAYLLGTTRQTPHDRYAAGTLIAVKDGGRLLFPMWQFDPDAADGVVVGLSPVLLTLKDRLSPLGTLRWFLSPKAQLGGRSPLDALRAGDVQSAAEEARTVGAS